MASLLSEEDFPLYSAKDRPKIGSGSGVKYIDFIGENFREKGSGRKKGNDPARRKVYGKYLKMKNA